MIGLLLAAAVGAVTGLEARAESAANVICKNVCRSAVENVSRYLLLLRASLAQLIGRVGIRDDQDVDMTMSMTIPLVTHAMTPAIAGTPLRIYRLSVGLLKGALRHLCCPLQPPILLGIMARSRRRRLRWLYQLPRAGETQGTGAGKLGEATT